MDGVSVPAAVVEGKECAAIRPTLSFPAAATPVPAPIAWVRVRVPLEDLERLVGERREVDLLVERYEGTPPPGGKVVDLGDGCLARVVALPTSPRAGRLAAT